MKLYKICDYVSERVAASTLSEYNYISTENMLPNKGGITKSSNIPSGNVIAYSNEDVLISNIRPYFKKIWQANIDGGCSADVLCVRAKETIYPRYLYYLLSQDSFFEYVMAGSKGCKMPRGDKQQIMQWDVKIPEIGEQIRIAEFLSSIDSKIELNRRINENLEQQAQALFKSWFVDFEPFKDGKFVDSEQGMIPEGWKVGNLEELVEVKYGKDHKKLAPGTIPVYGSGGIMRYVDQYLYNKESVLIPRKGSLNNVMYINRPFWTVDTMFYTRMKIEGIAKFIYLFMSPKDLLSMNSGSAVPSMTVDILNKIQIITPPINIIQKFECIMKPIFTKMDLCSYENQKLSQLRDTLLPRLMSGELEIKDNSYD